MGPARVGPLLFSAVRWVKPFLASLAAHGALLWGGYCLVGPADSGEREVVVPIAMELVESAPAPSLAEQPVEPLSPLTHSPALEPLPLAPAELSAPFAPEVAFSPPVSPSPALPSPGEAAPTIAPECAAVSETSAEPTVSVRPVYPRQARRRGIEGVVVVRLRVADDGSVTSVRIGSSSGSDVLDQAALEAASRTSFRPGTREGQPVEGEISLTFDFRLK